MRRWLRKLWLGLLLRLLIRRVLSDRLFPEGSGENSDVRQRLRRLLEACNERVPLYRGRFDTLLQGDADLLERFAAEVRPLDRHGLKQHGPELVPGDAHNLPELTIKTSMLTRLRVVLRGGFRFRFASGGTSGDPVPFWVTRAEVERRLRQQVAVERFFGWRPGDSFLYLGQADMHYRFDGIERILRPGGMFFILFQRLDDHSAESILRTIEHARPDSIHGMPAYLAELVGYARRKNRKILHSPHHIHVTGEVLSEDVRALLEEGFGTVVFQSYGSSELATIAVECSERNGLHVLEDRILLEQSEYGHMLVTTLLAYDLPLIRYDTGDRGEVVFEHCRCGISGKKIRRIDGRAEDFVTDVRGHKIFASLLRDLLQEANKVFDNQILRGQFIRSEAGLRFTLQFRNANAKAGDAVVYVQQALRRVLGYDVPGSVLKHSVLASGKHRFIVDETTAAAVVRARPE